MDNYNGDRTHLLVGLLRGLGRLALHNLRGGGLDNADSHGLPHVTDSEPEQSWVKRNIQRIVKIRGSHLPRGG